MSQLLPLTKRQREILDYLQVFIREHGYAPSLIEIGTQFNLRSMATTWKHLENLKAKGFISREWNRSRSLTLLTGDRRHCETCTCGTERVHSETISERP